MIIGRYQTTPCNYAFIQSKHTIPFKFIKLAETINTSLNYLKILDQMPGKDRIVEEIDCD